MNNNNNNGWQRTERERLWQLLSARIECPPPILACSVCRLLPHHLRMIASVFVCLLLLLMMMIVIQSVGKYRELGN